MSDRTSFLLGLVAGVGLMAGIVAMPGCDRSTSDDPDRIRLEIARMEAEVQVDAKSPQSSWVGNSDARTRAGNLAVLKERLRQIEAREKAIEFMLVPRL